MSHHVAVRRGSGQLALDPLRITGHVLATPFFGGAEPTAAEAAAPPPGAPFTPEMCDKLWRLPLPAGATRDHPAANPFGPDSPRLEPVAFPPLLVVSAGRDILHERRAALRGGAWGDGEAGGARRPRGAGARVLLPTAVERGGQRADPCREALRPQRQRRPVPLVYCTDSW
ncbi:hypothetical protein SEVIR_5G106500v4 [Setaria viridis]|uniref:Alpha/beta hydrolase fold-3 domain-containing protein n=1 Tax=Setaria viridis TaxID=4556 RepID=A0A4V6D6A8_SETVI|nr:hypothetical protein SEVIR_5G106500v2 [Setaria viridis]